MACCYQRRLKMHDGGSLSISLCQEALDVPQRGQRGWESTNDGILYPQYCSQSHHQSTGNGSPIDIKRLLSFQLLQRSVNILLCYTLTRSYHDTHREDPLVYHTVNSWSSLGMLQCPYRSFLCDPGAIQFSIHSFMSHVLCWLLSTLQSHLRWKCC